MQQPPALMVVYGLASTGFWTLAYLLALRRGFKDQSFGIPFVALAANVAWETLYSFHFPVPQFTKIGNIGWLVINCGLVFTCLKYGAREFDHPLVRRWFRLLFPVVWLVALGVEWGFIVAFQDTWGKTSGTGMALVNAALMVAMILRRQSARAQSLFIALSILLGNLTGYLLTLMPYPQSSPPPPPPTPAIFLHAVFAATLMLNVAYAGLVFWQCRREGLNPWRRW